LESTLIENAQSTITDISDNPDNAPNIYADLDDDRIETSSVISHTDSTALVDEMCSTISTLEINDSAQPNVTSAAAAIPPKP
jgi:hypothetical protein